MLGRGAVGRHDGRERRPVGVRWPDLELLGVLGLPRIIDRELTQERRIVLGVDVRHSSSRGGHQQLQRR